MLTVIQIRPSLSCTTKLAGGMTMPSTVLTTESVLPLECSLKIPPSVSPRWAISTVPFFSSAMPLGRRLCECRLWMRWVAPPGEIRLIPPFSDQSGVRIRPEQCVSTHSGRESRWPVQPSMRPSGQFSGITLYFSLALLVSEQLPHSLT